MKFLVYSVEPLNENATLERFEQGAEKDLTRIIDLLEGMNHERVMRHQTVSLLVDNIKYHKKSGMVTADVYKQTNPGKPLHQLADDGEEMTIQEILSEHEEAFVPGIMGMKKVDGEIHLLVENNFGSFFVSACKGMDITPHYSSEAIRAIQESETIGRTTLDFDDDFDLEASLFKPPTDGDVREDKGFGKVDLANKLTSLLNISQAHRMSFDINRDEWLDNVELFDELIESGIVTTVRVFNTKDNTVKLGEGGDRAIRRKIDTDTHGKGAVKEAFASLPQ